MLTLYQAFLALICVPFPFLFWKYGAAIREKCKYAAESAAFLKKMQNQYQEDYTSEEEAGVAAFEDPKDREKEHEEEREEHEQEAIDYSYEDESEQPRFERIRTTQSQQSRASLARTKSYEGNPFDLDRMNTRESFRWEARRKAELARQNTRSSKTSRK